MRRSLDQAFIDLRQRLLEWARSKPKPDVHIFVYPPEWEARMLARFPRFAEDLAPQAPIDLVDVGHAFVGEIERRKGLVARLTAVEGQSTGRLLHDLGEIAHQYLTRLLAAPLPPPAVARLLINTGALGTFVSYSTITNALHGDVSGSSVAAPAVLAFPGEGDERELNLMRLRSDTNYRVPRI
jgi:hypothetical protein